MNNPDPKTLRRPRFIVIEGIDGSGKSTVQALLSKELEYRWGVEVLTYGEPGGTHIGEKLRRIFKSVWMHPRVAHLVMEASRLNLLLQIESILVESNTSIILVDRHSDSTWAYQGVMGVEEDYIEAVQATYNNLPRPDLTIFLDIPPEVAKLRMDLRAGETKVEDTLDSKPLEFFEAVSDRYWKRINSNRSKYFVVDGKLSTPEIVSQIISFLERIPK